ncbi:MAG: alpha/beta fold hydrolase [Planctomycetes bacterium]|nr:alpha/beta fold hydrolase [Planctomycetota bacterium]
MARGRAADAVVNLVTAGRSPWGRSRGPACAPQVAASERRREARTPRHRVRTSSVGPETIGGPVIGLVSRIYAELIQRSLEKEIATAPRDPVTGVLRGAEPFFHAAGPHGCLLVHGYASTPAEVRPLGELLASRGFTVQGVLLPGHGRTPPELERTDWEDWYHEVEYGFLRLSKTCPRVSVVGFSTGATLSLHLAANHPVERLTCLSPWLALRHRWFYLLTPERYLELSRERIHYVKKPLPGNINDRAARRAYLSYRHIPLRPVRGAMELIDKVRSELPQVRSPLLIVHSRGDQTCSPDGAQEAHDRAGATEKKLVLLDRSNHVITLDHDRARVEEEVVAWMR